MMAHNEPSHLDVLCLPSRLLIFKIQVVRTPWSGSTDLMHFIKSVVSLTDLSTHKSKLDDQIVI